MTRLFAALAVALAAAGCGGQTEAYRDLGVVNEGYPVEVHDVRFEGARGADVTGYLVLPPGNGPYPAVVYLHGSGGGRLDLVVPATWLAARGAVALTVDSRFVRTSGPRPQGLAGLRAERDLIELELADLRRAVDVLAALPQVDTGRIGFVGFSAGARAGALLAGEERRIRAFVFMSGGSPPIESVATGEAAQILRSVDPLRAVRRARDADLLFQAGRDDEIVPRAALEGLFAAAGGRKEMRWYDAGHALGDRAYRDQLDWLARVLDVDGPAVEGAATGP